MNDDLTKTSLDPDLRPIDGTVGCLAESMGCTEDQVRDAIKVVGTSAEAVRLHLRLLDAIKTQGNK